MSSGKKSRQVLGPSQVEDFMTVFILQLKIWKAHIFGWEIDLKKKTVQICQPIVLSPCPETQTFELFNPWIASHNTRKGFSKLVIWGFIILESAIIMQACLQQPATGRERHETYEAKLSLPGCSCQTAPERRVSSQLRQLLAASPWHVSNRCSNVSTIVFWGMMYNRLATTPDLIFSIYSLLIGKTELLILNTFKALSPDLQFYSFIHSINSCTAFYWLLMTCGPLSKCLQKLTEQKVK